MSTFGENLRDAVLEKSQSKIWRTAVQEWTIADVVEDEESSSVCTCGKTGLRYLFTIENFITGNSLFPIGSECIKKFERDDLYNHATTTIDLFKLLHGIRERKFIQPTSDFFSRKLIQFLYDKDAIKSEKEYTFFLKMFNMTNKENITPKQQNWINGIIAYSIKPWLEANYGNKIKKKG